MPISEMINLSERLTWQWATQRMYCYRQEIPTLPDHMGSPFSIKSPMFVYCVLSVAFFVVDCFCSSQVLIVSLFIDFWLPLRFFFTIFYNKIMLYPFPTIIMSRHEIKDKKIILSYWYAKTSHYRSEQISLISPCILKNLIGIITTNPGYFLSY